MSSFSGFLLAGLVRGCRAAPEGLGSCQLDRHSRIWQVVSAPGTEKLLLADFPILLLVFSFLGSIFTSLYAAASWQDVAALSLAYHAPITTSLADLMWHHPGAGSTTPHYISVANDTVLFRRVLPMVAKPQYIFVANDPFGNGIAWESRTIPPRRAWQCLLSVRFLEKKEVQRGGICCLYFMRADDCCHR